MSLFDGAVIIVCEACCLALMAAHSLNESFLFTDKVEHEVLLLLQFLVVGGKEIGKLPKISVDFEVKFDVCIGSMGFVAEDFKIVLLFGRVEKVCVLDDALNDGGER